MKRVATNLLKFGVSGAILAFLIHRAANDAEFMTHFHHLRTSLDEKWPRFVLAWSVILASLVISIVRWHLLVVTLDLPFRYRDAFRLGFLGYLFNFVSLGNVGGDLFKAIFVAREHPGHRAEAVASVVVDRVIGLYGLFIVAAIAVVAGGLTFVTEPAVVRVVVQATLIGTLVGGVGIVMMLIPGFTNGALSELLAGLPRVGPLFARLIGAIRIYRKRLSVLVVALLLSVAVHGCSTIGCWLIATSLPGAVPPLTSQFIAVPLAMLAGALPLPMMGLGAVELVMDTLYQRLPAAGEIPPGQGLLVAVGFRVISILNAGVAMIVYLTSRRDLETLDLQADVASELESSTEELAEQVSPGSK